MGFTTADLRVGFLGQNRDAFIPAIFHRCPCRGHEETSKLTVHVKFCCVHVKNVEFSTEKSFPTYLPDGFFYPYVTPNKFFLRLA